MIDLHRHVLPGIDDGAADMDEALAICRAAADDGIEVLAATPHVRAHDYPTTAERMEEAFASLATAAEGIVRLVPGGELDLEELSRPVDELLRFALAGNPRYLLVETPYIGWPLDRGDRFFELRASGITPVLAHPERNTDVQQRPDCSSHSCRRARSCRSRPRECAATLVARELVHLVASDGHAPSVRAIGMRAAADALRDDALARWLTEDVPRAIVGDEKLPPRPEPSRKKKRFGRF